jgi:hypothetical protein
VGHTAQLFVDDLVLVPPRRALPYFKRNQLAEGSKRGRREMVTLRSAERCALRGQSCCSQNVGRPALLRTGS